MSNTFCVAVGTFLGQRSLVVTGAFSEWVQTVLDKQFDGVRERLAEAIGVTLTTLSRGMEVGTMGADTLLRLALVTGRNPSEVLRLAKKDDWADLIEQCYGPPRVESPLARELAEFAASPPLEAFVRLAVDNLRVAQEFLRGGSPAHSATVAARPARRRRPPRRGSPKR
jgi:hypothetical protein